MTLEEFKNILGDDPFGSMQKAISNAGLALHKNEIFFLLFKLLKDTNDGNRFCAIFYLIDQYSESLSNLKDTYINDIYDSLFDQYGPVADRAIWALNIIGDKALNKLIDGYNSASIDSKIRIVHAIGRGDFSKRTNERIEILDYGLESENKDLQFAAMSELMSNSPLSPLRNSKRNLPEADNIEFENIYRKILPIAKELASSDDEVYKEFSNRYIGWIENKKNYNKS